jgi:hypothetical protein
MRNGSLLGNRRVLGRARRLIGPGADVQIRAADQALGFDRRNGVGAHERMQVLGDLELHLEFVGRPIRREDCLHLTGFCARDANDRAGLKPRNFCELRVNRELLGERHLAVADHEQPDREQQNAGEDEDADAREAARLHATLRPVSA